MSLPHRADGSEAPSRPAAGGDEGPRLDLPSALRARQMKRKELSQKFPQLTRWWTRTETLLRPGPVSYTHLTLPTKLEV